MEGRTPDPLPVPGERGGVGLAGLARPGGREAAWSHITAPHRFSLFVSPLRAGTRHKKPAIQNRKPQVQFGKVMSHKEFLREQSGLLGTKNSVFWKQSQPSCFYYWHTADRAWHTGRVA